LQRKTNLNHLAPGIFLDFVQDDVSISKKNVLRGLHGDGLKPKQNATWKLIQCLDGEIFVVIVDVRKDSSTFKQTKTFILNDSNKYQLLIPPGCGNGHLCLSNKCIFHYKQSEYYKGQSDQFTIKWNSVGVNWPINGEPILSERDKNAEPLSNFKF
jgi:dTDP-4-dehydrorhamnose 3,5-epimerase